LARVRTSCAQPTAAWIWPGLLPAIHIEIACTLDTSLADCLFLGYPLRHLECGTATTGGGFPAHFDGRCEWGEGVTGVSLGAPAIMLFHRCIVPSGPPCHLRTPCRHGRETIRVELPRRSIYMMTK